jgi:hypothetical protein
MEPAGKERLTEGDLEKSFAFVGDGRVRSGESARMRLRREGVQLFEGAICSLPIKAHGDRLAPSVLLHERDGKNDLAGSGHAVAILVIRLISSVAPPALSDELDRK